jgi:hypothetical protein
VSVTFGVLHTLKPDSSATGVLHNGMPKGNYLAVRGQTKKISSYFPVLIACLQNNLLLESSVDANGKA